jgi:hypothetical protein
MRKWVAGISFCLAVILFGVAGWNFFQHHYCNAQRLNQELAAAHRPALLDEFLAQDRDRRQTELFQIFCGGILLFVAVTLWTGQPNPEVLAARLRRHLPSHH